ncbi:MAG: adenylosuccinate lyase [Kiritimatiellae bacterium]|nr:adenylosuccinate lyase [Kiritimatiellia bacterium]
MSDIPNILAQRYATEGMRNIWSAEGKIVLEREFWIAVLKAQRDLGLDVPAAVIAAYECAKDKVDLDSIQTREAVTRHDVKARIEEFCALAGHEQIHKGMTSRDLTENVEQLQVLRALQYVLPRSVAVLQAFADAARRHRDLVIAARTHNVAAQPTTLGKRLAMFGEEMMLACRRLETLVARYPVRGLRGAVGTQLDQMTLFGGDVAKAAALDDRIVEHLGFKNRLEAVGQVYPRSLDFDVISALFQLSCGPSSFATTLRLMAGHELASEGFAKGQVGSSAMPHKMNSRSCERINGFHTILRGHVTMAAGLAGDQWNEGDVSCSVVRRVVLPDSFFALDGALETTLTVLSQMEAYPEVIARENRRYLPFLATTTILMKAVQAGAGREQAHELIREHAIAAVRDLRAGKTEENDLVDRLAREERIPLTRDEIQAVVEDAARLTGAAAAQVDGFCAAVDDWGKRYPQAAGIEPGRIL